MCVIFRLFIIDFPSIRSLCAIYPHLFVILISICFVLYQTEPLKSHCLSYVLEVCFFSILSISFLASISPIYLQNNIKLPRLPSYIDKVYMG